MPLENRIQLPAAPVRGLTHTHTPKSLDHISHWPVERHAANPANLDLTPASLTSSPAAALMAARGHRLPLRPCALLVSCVSYRYRVCQRALNYPWFGPTGIAAPALCSCRLRHGCFVETLPLGKNTSSSKLFGEAAIASQTLSCHTRTRTVTPPDSCRSANVPSTTCDSELSI